MQEDTWKYLSLNLKHAQANNRNTWKWVTSSSSSLMKYLLLTVNGPQHDEYYMQESGTIVHKSPFREIWPIQRAYVSESESF